MPIYEYHCEECGTFEATQKITERALRRCPTCKGKVRKLISSTSFQLKGTGWYVTDYPAKGNGGKPKEEGASAPAESKSASSTPKESPSKKSEATAA